MPKASSANPIIHTLFILVIGEVTSGQYQPARVNLIDSGFKPQIIRLYKPATLIEECENRDSRITHHCINGLISEDEAAELRENLGAMVIKDLFGVKPEDIKSIVLTDDVEKRYGDDLERSMLRCGVNPERWLVGLDGSPAYYIG